MNINIKRELLLPALQRANGVIEKRQAIPILSNVLFQCEAQQLIITATDTEVEVNTTISIGTQDQTKVALPARKLFDICKELPENADIKIDISEKQAKIKSGKSRFTLALSSAQEFPKIGDFDTLCEFDLDVGLLKDLIDKTEFAMALQDVRHYLNGLLLEVSSETIKTVATDGHRLAMAEKRIKVNPRELIQSIIPRKGILEISRLLSSFDKSSKVNLMIGTNHFKVMVKNEVSLTTKLLEGSFPNYKKVIPMQTSTPLFIGKEILKGGLNRAAVLASDRNPLVKMNITEELVMVTGSNHEQEEAVEELEAEYSGQSMEVGFNASYLQDILQAISSDSVRIDLQGADASCLVSVPNNEDLTYVVMPMRI
ncbi:MAG: DNA polymerase III subunit beta [Pseudomonadota bacterium]|nr:DNA polymerase III subunit beta [Pseudomonadota bacterium]